MHTQDFQEEAITEESLCPWRLAAVLPVCLHPRFLSVLFYLPAACDSGAGVRSAVLVGLRA